MITIKDIAEMLGVEIGEEFEVPKFSSCKYRFTENSLESYGDSDRWVESTGAVIYALLKGEVKIVKKPWKPKCGNTYFVVLPNRCSGITWNNDIYDQALYAVGNCFHTKEEAEKHKNEVLARLQQIYDIGKPLIRV